MTDQELRMWQDDVKMIGKLREENEELKLIINKVIEYIEHTPNFVSFKDTYVAKQLLNMLKQVELIGNK